MTDLIHNGFDHTATALTFDDIAATCPAAFTGHASPAASERYGHVSTLDAIDLLRQHGFEATRAIQKPCRNPAEIAFADHMLTFAPINSRNGSDGQPDRAQIVLYNSHNAKSSLKLFAGAFRFICSNGIIAGEGFESKMRHTRLTAQSFSDMVEEQARNLPDMMHKIERMKETPLDRDQIVELAYNATKLRWDMESDRKADRLGSFATSGTVSHLHRPRRYGDLGADLWTTFNVAQESLIRGGVRVASFTKANPYGSIRKAKGVTSLPESLRINRSLWDLADALV